MSLRLSPAPGRLRLQGIVTQRLDDGRSESFQAGRIDTGEEDVQFVAEHLPVLRPGVSVGVDGHWETHPAHGLQLRVIKVRSVDLPRTRAAVERLLREVPGFGPAYAKKVVARCGFDTFTMLRQDPALLTKIVPGKRGRTLQLGWEKWAREWESQMASVDFASELIALGCTPYEAWRTIDFFRSPGAARAVLLRHPFRLLEVPGFGWKRAEQVGRALQVPDRDPGRLSAAAVEASRGLMDQGSSAGPVAALRKRVASLVTEELASEALSVAAERGCLVPDGDLIYQPQALEAEWTVASHLRRLSRRRLVMPQPDERRVEVQLKRSHLNAEQQEAVWNAVREGVSVLTGGPGTGKTTTTREMVRALDTVGARILMVAPTGRAAMRSTEVAGVPATTLHKAIGGPPGTRRKSPISEDVVLVEEASMVSVEMMAWLLTNLSDRTRLVLIGDADQLPSVEHGAVLRDVLHSDMVPSVNLTSIYRQGPGSGIVQAARNLLEGDSVDGREGPGFLFVDTSGFQEGRVLQRLGDALTWLAQQAPGDRPQVLTPTKRGPLGTRRLNLHLQHLLNPGGDVGPTIGSGAVARVGDPVVQVRNDYSLGAAGVMNGQLGDVIDVGPGRLRVRFDDDVLWIEGFRRFNLQLAWALTIHKGQGSEWENVVILAATSHGPLLARQLLYTALTRAKERAVLIASGRALRTAAARDIGTERVTGLARHLEATYG